MEAFVADKINSILDFYEKDFFTLDEKTLKAYVADLNSDKGGILATQENQEILNVKFPKLNNQYSKISKIGKVLIPIKKENLIKILIHDEKFRLQNTNTREVLDEYYSCKSC